MDRNEGEAEEECLAEDAQRNGERGVMREKCTDRAARLLVPVLCDALFCNLECMLPKVRQSVASPSAHKHLVVMAQALWSDTCTCQSIYRNEHSVCCSGKPVVAEAICLVQLAEEFVEDLFFHMLGDGGEWCVC